MRVIHHHTTRICGLMLRYDAQNCGAPAFNLDALMTALRGIPREGRAFLRGGEGGRITVLLVTPHLRIDAEVVGGDNRPIATALALPEGRLGWSIGIAVAWAAGDRSVASGRDLVAIMAALQDAATAIGISWIAAFAGKNAGEGELDGYHIWYKIGFDLDRSDPDWAYPYVHAYQSLIRGTPWAGCTPAEMTRTAAGRAFWREYGIPLPIRRWVEAPPMPPWATKKENEHDRIRGAQRVRDGTR